MWARSGIIIDRDIRGKFGAPLSKIGTLPGKLILFNPFFKWSLRKPFICIDISKSLDDMALTSHVGSNGSGAPGQPNLKQIGDQSLPKNDHHGFLIRCSEHKRKFTLLCNVLHYSRTYDSH